MIIYLVVGLIKVLLYKMSYFPEPYTHSKNKKNKLDLSNCPTRAQKVQQASMHQNLLQRLI